MVTCAAATAACVARAPPAELGKLELTNSRVSFGVLLLRLVSFSFLFASFAVRLAAILVGSTCFSGCSNLICSI